MKEQLQDQLSPAFRGGLWARLDASVRERLELYARELLRFNPATNLISRRDPEERAIELIEECCEAAAGLSEIPGPWLDFGSGGGFPGIVFACMYPEREIVLVERRRSRADFLERCCRLLELNEARVQALDLARLSPNSRFGLGTAKAVAAPSKIVPWLEPHIAEDGSILLFVRPGWSVEAEAMAGWRVRSSWETTPDRSVVLLGREG